MGRLFEDVDGLKQQFKFNHGCSSIVKAFGINNERFMFVNSLLSKASKKFDSSSMAIEYIANHDKLNDFEKMFAIFMYGGYTENMRRLSKDSKNDVIIHEISGASIPKLMEVIDFLSSTNPSESNLDDVVGKIKNIMSHE